MRKPQVHPDGPSLAAVVASCQLADAPTSSGGRGDEVTWEVSPPVFRVVWCTLFALNVSIATYVLALGLGYVALTYVGSIAYYAGMFRLLSLDAFPVVISGYVVVAAVYYVRAARFVLGSVRHRRLMFPSSAPQARGEPERSKQPCRGLVHLRRQYDRVCSVRGEFFEPMVGA